MFERFTEPARRVVVLAQEDARSRADGRIATEHLLLGVCRVRDGAGAALLAERGVDAATVESDLEAMRAPAPTDRDALASLGIDLDEVRGRVEETFGPGALENTRAAGRARWGRGRGARLWGHIPFDAQAKKVLELSLREAVRAGSRSLGTEHVLLGLLHPGTGRGQRILDARGVTLAEVREAVDRPGRGASGM